MAPSGHSHSSAPPSGAPLYPSHDDSVRSGPPPGGWAYDAVIFDMDGVITDTAAVHATAWKRMFDEFLRTRAGAGGPAFREFSPASDYRRFVDGKPRYDGVASFLRSRGFDLPWGEPGDPPGRGTICGLGNRKNELFNALVAHEGVRTYPSSLGLIEALGAAGLRVGLATSSRNAGLVLRHARVEPLFPVVVDGLVSEKLGLKGKPEPDIFVTACARLGTTPGRAVVVEDAVSGVQAGARGGFALVLGVAREDNAAELQRGGADVVVSDLAGLTPESLDRKVRLRAAAR